MRCRFCCENDVRNMKQHLYSRNCVRKAYSKNIPNDRVTVPWIVGKRLAQAGFRVYLAPINHLSYNRTVNRWVDSILLVIQVQSSLFAAWSWLHELFPKKEFGILTSEDPLSTLDNLWAIRAMGEGFDDTQKPLYPRLQSFLSNSSYKGGMVPLKLRRKK